LGKRSGEIGNGRSATTGGKHVGCGHVGVNAAFKALDDGLDGLVRYREPLARHTTLRIGGPVALYLECDTVSDVALALEVLTAEGIEFTVLGRGSNVLAADDGYDGAVIVLGREFRRYALDTQGRLKAGAGVALAAIVQEAFSAGMTGLEFAVGIPGTLGGALCMNAGTRDEWICDVVESVVLYAAGHGLVSVRGPEVDWAYRGSSLARQGIILESTLRLNPGDTSRIRASMESSLKRRRRNQPVALPNAGSVFRNPEGDSAGRLIESVGLKGASVGGAQISDAHANFIVNAGDATAHDFLTLVHMARDAVLEQHGIELKPEIKFLGSFKSP